MTNDFTNKYAIDKTWDGRPIPARELATLSFSVEKNFAVILVDAPYSDDPRPPGPLGSTDRLWEYEVVEFFLLGDNDTYLEIELGPHGHYLVLGFKGSRNVTLAQLPIDFAAKISRRRWTGKAIFSTDYLPQNLIKCNAYAIRGCGVERKYYAHYPLGGIEPDFHRLRDFGPLKT